MSRIIRRLRTHGLIKKASHCYESYLTALGKQAIALGLKRQELVTIPEACRNALSLSASANFGMNLTT